MRRVIPGFVMLALLVSAASGETVAIRAARILTMAGPEIEKGTVLIRDGKIVAVGAKVEVPEAARAIEAKKSVVMPAWIVPHAWRMVDRSNERMPVVPLLSVVDSIDPDSLTMEQFRRDGVGTVGAFQGNATQIGAQGCVLKPVGIEVSRMIVRRNAGLTISLEPMRGSNRMAHTAAIRAVLDAIRPIVKERAKLRKAKKDLPDLDPKLAPLVALLEGRTPAHIWCPRAMDVPRALKLIDTYGMKAVLVLGTECHKAASLIAEAKVPVILADALEALFGAIWLDAGHEAAS
ncbi:MAG: hypothetical protein GY704_01830, partial [Phycisphaeraceae bacterium]|nr:hypothetical protein [Phycisphaeraceae bacterium]